MLEKEKGITKKLNVWGWLPIIVFCIVSFADLATTLVAYLSKGFPEVNPLYWLIGNFWFFLVVQIILVFFLIFIYWKQWFNAGLFGQYFIFLWLWIVSVARGLAAWSNFQWLLVLPKINATIVVQLEQRAAEQSVQLYSNFLVPWMLYPAVVALLVFFFFGKAKGWNLTKTKKEILYDKIVKTTIKGGKRN